MSSIVELSGFLGVLLRALELVAQSVLGGSVAFLLLAASPLDRVSAAASLVQASSLRVTRGSAWLLCAIALAATTLNAAVLESTLRLGFADILPARFVVTGLVEALAAAAAALLARPGNAASAHRRWREAALVLCVFAVLAASLATTHASARPMLDPLLLAATVLHQAGAALWLGGLPCFYRALGTLHDDSAARAWLGTRYSALSVCGVALIVAGAAVLTFSLVASWPALYGTAYGAMAAMKGVLLALLLLVGLANFIAVRRFGGSAAEVTRVRRFVEVEMAFGVAVLALAASMTSSPPAVDLAEDRVTLHELVERFTPQRPRLDTPEASSLAIATLQRKLDAEAARSGEQSSAFLPGGGEPAPRNANDVAWSEYNHHWAGLLVALIGVFALIERSGRANWARHWPLLFLALAAFILLRADPEVWPLGTLGPLESLKDPEVVQHRLFAVMTAAFASFEWRVRAGRYRSQVPALVFPVLMVAGGVLLLTHSHAISDVKEQVLIEWSHLPLGVLGVAGGAARWLQLRAAAAEARWAGWIWPVCLVLSGLVLLDYREA